MSAPPGSARRTTEPLSGVITGLAGDTEPATQWAIRFLMKEIGLTGSQARRLLVAYKRDRADDARKATREEFRAWFRRRGDLLIVRSKPRHAWKVTSS